MRIESSWRSTSITQNRCSLSHQVYEWWECTLGVIMLGMHVGHAWHHVLDPRVEANAWGGFSVLLPLDVTVSVIWHGIRFSTHASCHLRCSRGSGKKARTDHHRHPFLVMCNPTFQSWKKWLKIIVRKRGWILLGRKLGIILPFFWELGCSNNFNISAKFSKLAKLCQVFSSLYVTNPTKPQSTHHTLLPQCHPGQPRPTREEQIKPPLPTLSKR